MYSRFLLFIGLFVLIFACSQTPIVEDVIEIETVVTEIPEIDTFNYDTLSGMYTGDFDGSDIRIIINYISKTNAIGYNIHKGLQRNINGNVMRQNDSIIVRLAEPGDHEYDGVFELLFLENDEAPTGKWISNSGNISEKTFSLEKLHTHRKNADWSDAIDASNFSDFIDFASNGIGEFTFESNGLVLFSYYPEEIEIDWNHIAPARVEQSTEITGNWTIKEDQLIISWQKNNVFPTSTMLYTIIKHSYDIELFGSNDTIITSMYP